MIGVGLKWDEWVLNDDNEIRMKMIWMSLKMKMTVLKWRWLSKNEDGYHKWKQLLSKNKDDYCLKMKTAVV